MTVRRRLREDREVFIGMGLIAVSLLLVVAGLGGFLKNPFGGEDMRTVRAVFDTTQQLRVGDDVRLAGVTAGTVKDISLNPSREASVVTMEVEKSAGPLFDDARATVQYKTVLGGTFYLDLDLGSSGRPLGAGPIPESRTLSQVELDDVLDITKGGGKEGLQILTGEMAEALRGEDDFAALFDKIADVSPPVSKGLEAVRGEQLDRDLQGFVHNSARTIAAFNTPRDEIRDVIAGGAATLQTTAARDDELRAMLDLMPSTSREVNATLSRLQITLNVADPLVGDLQASARFIEPTFAALRPTLVDTNGLLNRARPLIRGLRPASISIAGAARRALPIVRALRPSFDRLQQRNLPALLEVDAVTEKSTATMIGGGLTGLAGISGQMDANGHLIRFPATSGSSPISSLPCQTYFNNPDSESFISCSNLKDAVATYLDYDPTSPPEGSADPADEGGAK